jgi:hypothetical protein
MNHYIVLVLQIGGLVFPWFKAFQIGRYNTHHKSSFLVINGTKKDAVQPNIPDGLQNLLCASSIEDTPWNIMMVIF